ncbi:hypothetical protein TNCV_2226551 [Trichonephila clavipes]|nr:hypothetical protein TNCV_2226551 [Trichonephila clavipes]
MLLVPIPLEHESIHQIHLTFPHNSAIQQVFIFEQLSQGNVPAVQKMSRRNREREETAMAGSDVVQSGRPIFDDFFQHLWPYIGNNTANVVFQMVKRLCLIRIDQ